MAIITIKRIILNILELFEKNNIINNLSIYETAYEISLGFFLSNNNIKKPKNELELQYTLGSIYEVCKDLNNDFTFLEKEIKKQASMDALQEIVNSNMNEAKSGRLNIEEYVNKINDNEFFNDLLEELFSNNLGLKKDKYNLLINDELATAILNSLKDLEINE